MQNLREYYKRGYTMTQDQLNNSLLKFVEIGDFEIVKLLVEKGADIHAWDDRGFKMCS